MRQAPLKRQPVSMVICGRRDVAVDRGAGEELDLLPGRDVALDAALDRDDVGDDIGLDDRLLVDIKIALGAHDARHLALDHEGLGEDHLAGEFDVEGEDGIELILVDRGYLDFCHTSWMIRQGGGNGNEGSG